MLLLPFSYTIYLDFATSRDNVFMLSHSLILFSSLLIRTSVVSFVYHERNICIELERAVLSAPADYTTESATDSKL